MSEGCIFCRIVHGEASAHVVYEDERVMAFLDINPCSPGHTLIIPKVHVQRLEELPEEEAIALFRALHRLLDPLQRAVGAESTTIGVNNGPESGQEVPHVHIHVIPRFRGDGGGIVQGVARLWRRQTRGEMERIAQRIRNLAGSSP